MVDICDKPYKNQAKDVKVMLWKQIVTGFIRASMSKIQGLFKDF